MKRFIPLTRSSSFSYQPAAQNEQDALTQLDFYQPHIGKWTIDLTT